MADNFFKVKNGLNLPTLSADPTVTPPANSAAGDMAFYNGKLYIHNGTAWGIKPGSGSTGLIVNADVDNAAAIAGTKVDPNFGNQTVQTTGLVSAATLRASTKLEVLATQANEAVYIQQLGAGNALVIEDSANPDTTAFVVDASGNLGLGVAANTTLTEKLTVSGDVKVSTGDIKLDTAKGIESNSAASTLNIGTGTNTQTLNLGTGSGTQTVNIGTGAGTTTINIGATGDSVVIAGTLTTVNTTNLDVADKNITLNKGGIAGSANGSGISIEAGGSSVASISFDQTDSGAQPQNTFILSGTGSLALPAGTTAQRPNTPANGMVRYNSDNGAFEGYASGAWSGIGGGGTVDRITQASHGFVVGDVLYINGGNYAKAQADTAAKAEVVGMVSRVIDASNFELTLNGEVSGLTGLTMGENYFLSASSAGAITATEPSVVGQISLPIGVASSTTTLYVAPKRGSVVGGANVRTQIGLANNATTTVQNAGSYDAGSIEGWVYLDATTDYRFYIQAQFARNGLGNNYNLSYQTTGDTPPVGFSMGITAAGLIQVTLPNLAGFVAGGSFINFALNAPAVGATLPLQVDSANVSFTNIQAASAAGITFKEDGGTTTMTITDAGAVGIGTASPSSKFEVKDSSTNCAGTVTSANSSIQLQSNATDGYMNMIGAGNLVFRVGNPVAERMRIDASGQLLVGATAPVFGSSSVGKTVIAANNVPLQLRHTASVAGKGWNVGPGSIANEFVIYNQNSTGVYLVDGQTSWQANSDQRLKKNIKPLELGLEQIKALKPARFDYNQDESEESARVGFIAQEVLPVLPHAVSVPEDSEQMMGVSATEMIPVLVKAIQEQQAQIEEMKAKLAALEAK